MIFDRLFKRPETREQLIIHWADTLILNSDYIGNLDRRGFKLDWVFENQPTQEEAREWLNHPSRAIREHVISMMDNKDPIAVSNALIPYLEDVKMFLLKEGYINPIEVVKQEWVLTDRGKLVKELQGHHKYVKHRKREINILKNQNFINWCLIIATVLAAVMPFIASWIFQPNQSVTNSQKPTVDTVWMRQIINDELRQKESNRDTVIQTKLRPPK